MPTIYKDSDKSRFAAMTKEAENGCLLWTGAIRDEKNGYGAFRHGSKRIPGDRKLLLAHRVAWEMANGPIPDGLFILHSCNNPLCVSLDHLRPDTHAANMADRANSWRTKTPDAPLTAEERSTLLLFAEAGKTPKETARAWGLHLDTVTRGLKLAWKERERTLAGLSVAFVAYLTAVAAAAAALPC